MSILSYQYNSIWNQEVGPGLVNFLCLTGGAVWMAQTPSPRSGSGGAQSSLSSITRGFWDFRVSAGSQEVWPVAMGRNSSGSPSSAIDSLSLPELWQPLLVVVGWVSHLQKPGEPEVGPPFWEIAFAQSLRGRQSLSTCLPSVSPNLEVSGGSWP